MEKKPKYLEYDDIEIDISKSVGLCLDEIEYLKDLKDRKLTLSGEVCSFTVDSIVHDILKINADDKGIPVEERKPILLYICSPGGSVDAGEGLISAIITSKTPVYTINTGYEYSMGSLIGLAGHKRYTMPKSRFLMHDGSNFIYDSGNKARDQMDFNVRVEERIKEFVLEHSNLTKEEYESKTRVEWYLFAEDAKEKGFTDYIIGVDCDIDEVI